MFFSQGLPRVNKHLLTTQTTSCRTIHVVHNYSNLYLTQSHLNILDKGLSFVPIRSFTLEDRLQFLTQFDSFSNTLRKIVISGNRKKDICSFSTTPDTATSLLHRDMKFLRRTSKEMPEPHLTVNNAAIENCIEKTKMEIDKELEKEQKAKIASNISKKDWAAIKDLKKKSLVIKPADKNLGIAILNSEDYVSQCLIHLASTTYTRVETFPTSQLFKTIQNVLIRFKEDLDSNKKLYRFLQPNINSSLPSFYGLPKIHKPPDQKGIPPLRPIVSHNNTLLSNTAQFLDHACSSASCPIVSRLSQ